MILSDDILHDRDPAVVSHGGGSPVIYDREKSHLFPSQILFPHAVRCAVTVVVEELLFRDCKLLRAGVPAISRKGGYLSLDRAIYTFARFSRKALDTTDRELNAIAAPATMGLNRIPKNG
jgi:hypothetical protein